MSISTTPFHTFLITDAEAIKTQVLNWLKQFNTFCFLDSNLYTVQNKTYEILIGVGAARRYTSSLPTALSQLQGFINEKKSWLFGHIGYDVLLAHPTPAATKEDALQFPDIFFFEPEIILQISHHALHIAAADPAQVYAAITHTTANSHGHTAVPAFESKLSRQEYLNVIAALQKHIRRGDCYEINFCQEFFATHAQVNPFALFQQLNKISPNPFAAFYHFDDKWLLCASPERFLQKTGNLIISQPIKGTLPRKASDAATLQQEQQYLQESEKDKAENVMVVDLVRNDFSKICEKGSVNVAELFGVYSFPQVHQMISTISGTLRSGIHFTDIIQATFPMGSMTGAPKISVLQLIAQYEKSKRGIFSGTVGYISPTGDFDFNVVIRSLMYNSQTRYLSYQTGSGITTYSNPEKEWEECIVKGAAIQKIGKL